MKIFVKVAALAALTLAAGCAAYSWKSSVPPAMRTVAVPVFRNESKVTELGSVVTRQLLREFQREGTFKLAQSGESALEIQGVIRSASGGVVAYDRSNNMRNRQYQLLVRAEVSVIDKVSGQVLVDNKVFTGETSYISGGDYVTDRRDASGRAAEDLARKVVDEVLNLKWEGAGK